METIRGVLPSACHVLQMDLTALQVELAQCKREKQDLLTKVAQHTFVDSQQRAAVKQAREQCGKGYLQLGGHKSLPIQSAAANILAAKEIGIASKV